MRDGTKKGIFFIDAIEGNTARLLPEKGGAVEFPASLLPAGARRGLEWFNLILCLAVTAFLFYSSFGSVAYVAKTGETSTGLHLPFTYLYASMVVGFGLGTFRYIQRIILEMKGKKEPKEEQK